MNDIVFGVIWNTKYLKYDIFQFDQLVHGGFKHEGETGKRLVPPNSTSL